MSGGFADNPILREYARGKSAGETRGITFLVQALLALYEDVGGEIHLVRPNLLLKRHHLG
jgi:hypothetical protein